MTRKPKEDESAPASQLDPQRKMEQLLAHVFNQPLDVEALGEMVALSEHVTRALTPDVQSDPWSKTPTETNPATHPALRELDGVAPENGTGLEEDTANTSSPSSLTPEAVIKSRLLEFQIYLKYKLFGRAHNSLQEAQVVARQASRSHQTAKVLVSHSDAQLPPETSLELSTDVFEELPELEDAMHGPERYLTIIHRLLSLAETIEDTRVISLHAPNSPPWAGFVAQKGRICFGVVINGRLEFDATLELEAPALFQMLSEIEGDNLLAIQDKVADTVNLQERRALIRQMARAFIKLVELPVRTPFRIKRTKVEDLGRISTFSPFDIYQEACIALVDVTSPKDDVFRQFDDVVDFSAAFKLLGRMPPCILRCSDRLTMTQLDEFAIAADILVKTARRLSTTSDAQIILPMGDHFWCCYIQGLFVGFGRFKMVYLGRVTGAWATRTAPATS